MFKPTRIEPAFDNPEQIREMFDQHGPYRAIAAYAPGGIVDESKRPEPGQSGLPRFRGNWALSGKPLVEGAETILHNKRFLDAAKALFGTPHICPDFVVVNINGPMPAGTTHVDIPCFKGATREYYPLPFLRVMGLSGLFEAWRVVQAGAISWFYEGRGGNFDYWPEGLDGPMLSEQPPFRNVALIADNDRMYHRIGALGDPDAELPRISSSAQIQPDGDGNWTVVEDGEILAMYPSNAIRFSVIWKATVRNTESDNDNLTLDRIMEIFTANLRHRNVEYQAPSDPLADTAWLLLLQRIYADATAALGR